MKHTIARKIGLAFGGALALTVIVMTSIGAYNVRKQAIDTFNTESETRIRQVDDTLATTFQEVEQNLSFLADSPQLRSANQSLTEYMTHGGMMTPDKNGPTEQSIFDLMKRFGDSHPGLRYIDIGTRWGGYVQWPIEDMGSKPYDPRVRPWYELALTDPEHTVRPAPYTSAVGGGDPIIPFSRVIKDDQGGVLGVLENDLSLEGFAALTRGVHFEKSGYMMVTDATGKVLIDPHDKSHSFKPLDSLGEGYKALAAVADGPASVAIDGLSYQSVVYTSPKNKWRYIALVPKSEVMASANRLTALLIAAGAIVFGIALAIAIALGRTVTLPLRALVTSMKEIGSGEGDLTKRLPVRSTDEIGDLAEHFNAFVGMLQKLMKQISVSSVQVKLVSNEINEDNASLATRTEQQAATIQETAASMAELAGTVARNADSARKASDVATQAVKIAERGDEAVASVASTMTQISEQSTRMEDIIGIIESIAFQTNILALNAAVEAARAGESGRGFAVVAGEVRNLASRSSESAKQIKQLLEESGASVRVGSTLTKAAGTTISELARAVAEVASITEQISIASSEQRQGIEQVNLAVSQLDETTQHNAVMVEQISATSQSLATEGNTLNTSIGYFRLE